MSLGEDASTSADHGRVWDDEAFRELLRDQPPSAKLVAKVLAGESDLSQDAIVEESLLPRRTVSYALNRLEDAGLVSARRHVDDPRRQRYTLDGAFDS